MYLLNRRQENKPVPLASHNVTSWPKLWKRLVPCLSHDFETFRVIFLFISKTYTPDTQTVIPALRFLLYSNNCTSTRKSRAHSTVGSKNFGSCTSHSEKITYGKKVSNIEIALGSPFSYGRGYTGDGGNELNLKTRRNVSMHKWRILKRRDCQPP